MTKLPEKVGEVAQRRLSFSSEAFDASDYGEVAKRARLREVQLVESSYVVKLQVFREAEDEAKPLKQVFSGQPKGPNFNASSGAMIGGYEWIAEVKFGRLNALKLKAQYLVVYGNLKEANEDYARLYFQKVARFTTYPYFRAYFALQSSSSGLSLAALPSLTDRVD